MDEKYYLVTIILSETSDSGKQKKNTEKYLFKGFNYTDVEAKVVKEFEGETLDYEIKSISDSKILKIVE